MSENIFDIEIHPSADVFPMIPKDELKELAADIKENGLIHPIVVKDGMLIDGRNRLAACKIAKVEPVCTELNGQDPDSYIISSNINRRHMTKGQRGIVVAMVYPEKQQGKKNDLLQNVTSDIAKRDISQGRTILKYAPDLAENVLSGAKTISEAYKTAMQRKLASEEGDEALETLRDTAPDLADLVSEERMALDEALAALDERETNERANRIGIASNLRDGVSFFTGLHSCTDAKIELFRGHTDDIEKVVGMPVSEIIKQVKAIQSNSGIIKFLESINE